MVKFQSARAYVNGLGLCPSMATAEMSQFCSSLNVTMPKHPFAGFRIEKEFCIYAQLEFEGIVDEKATTYIVGCDGGDHAPEIVVKGADRALAAYPDISLIFVGDERKIVPY